MYLLCSLDLKILKPLLKSVIKDRFIRSVMSIITLVKSSIKLINIERVSIYFEENHTTFIRIRLRVSVFQSACLLFYRFWSNLNFTPSLILEIVGRKPEGHFNNAVQSIFH